MNSFNKIVFLDIEANGLKPWEVTEIFCVCIEDMDGVTGKITKPEIPNKEYPLHTLSQRSLEDEKAFLIKTLNEADLIVGHNIIMYDAPVLKHVWNVEIPLEKTFDTLLVSRLLQPDREGGHSLKMWGERVGVVKLDFTDFTAFSDEMLRYCRQDVKITKETYKRLQREMESFSLNGKAIKIEHIFAHLIQKQIEAGFKLDLNKAEHLYQELLKEYENIYEDLLCEMPKKRLDTECYNKAKTESRLLKETDDTFSYSDKRGKIITKDIKFERGNPTSRQQFSKHLIENYGWKPEIFTETGQPQISEAILQDLTYPFAKKGARLFRVQKQMGMIKDGDNAWLKHITPEGRIHGDVITNGTNTGRCSHSRPNIAQVDKKDIRMREVWVADTGKILIDVDASGLELRILSHYLTPYDKGLFANEVVNGDVHALNKEVMGLQDRESAKTAIYALIYGAGNAKLGKIAAKDSKRKELDGRRLMSSGKELRDNIEANFLGYKQLVEDVKTAYIARGYLIGLDGRPLHPRSDYSALNLLIQSAGAIIMKQALINSYNLLYCKGFELGVDYNYVANIHDEIVIESKPNIADQIKDLVIQSIQKVTADFNLKVKLDGEGKIGGSWAEVH